MNRKKSTRTLETFQQVRIPPNTKYLSQLSVQIIQQLASDANRRQKGKYALLQFNNCITTHLKNILGNNRYKRSDTSSSNTGIFWFH